MVFSKKILSHLPDSLQDLIMKRVIASGKWKSIPTFHMLFRSYEIMGADHQDLLTIFNNARDMKDDFYNRCREVARNREKIAQSQLTIVERISEYQKVILLYFLADWVSILDEKISENYQDLKKTSQILEKLCSPRVEKINIPWKRGQIFMRLRIPTNSLPRRVVPIVLLFQGNDTIKETLLFLEESFLRAGFAILNIDQPGWGESRETNTSFESMGEIPELATILFNFVKTRSELDSTRICVCGFSGGGTYAAMIAAAEKQFKCFISYGGGIYNLESAIRGLPSSQKLQVLKHWRCPRKELEKRLQELHYNSILPKITAKTLIIHGEQDTLMPILWIKEAEKLISGPKTTHYVKGGDHMCSDTMQSTEIPFMLTWLKENL